MISITLAAICCFALLCAGVLGGWGLALMRLDRRRQNTPPAAPSGPQAPDIDDRPPFTPPLPDDDQDGDETASWLHSLGTGPATPALAAGAFMHAHEADWRVVQAWLDEGRAGWDPPGYWPNPRSAPGAPEQLPEAGVWAEDWLVMHGVIPAFAGAS